jgi:lysophospholipase L1-like esterase
MPSCVRSAIWPWLGRSHEPLVIRLGIILLIGALVGLSCDRLGASIRLRSHGGGSPQTGITTIVAHGDSITEGYPTCNPPAVPVTCPTAYPYQTALLLGSPVISYNYGDPGAGYALNGGISGMTLLQTAPLWVDSYATNPGARLIIFAGTNDIYVSANPTTTYTYFQAYITARQSAGWPANHIVVPEMISRTSPSIYRAPWNALLASGAATYGYQEIPLSSDTLIGQDGDYSNTTYFLDGTHQTAAGHLVIANDLIGPTASCPACPGIH